MRALEFSSRSTNGAVHRERRRRQYGWLVAAMLVAAISSGVLMWRGRQEYQETLTLLNQYGRAEEELAWPWLQLRRAGIPMPRWFPREVHFADHQDWDTREFLHAAGRCHTLRGINISSEELRDEDFSPLGRLTQLREIELSYTDHFTGVGFRYLPRQNSVVKVVTETTGITDEGVAQLARFPKLSELELVDCQLTDKGLAILAQLPNLKVLAVSSPHLTSQGVAALAESRSLRYLGILWEDPADDNPGPVTAEAVEELQRRMPWCRCSFEGQSWK